MIQLGFAAGFTHEYPGLFEMEEFFPNSVIVNAKLLRQRACMDICAGIHQEERKQLHTHAR